MLIEFGKFMLKVNGIQNNNRDHHPRKSWNYAGMGDESVPPNSPLARPLLSKEHEKC